MESPSTAYTREDQQRLLTPHEYTGEALSLRYQNCISCGHRTEFTCVKCGYCYSCHWKREQVEEIELRDNLRISMLRCQNLATRIRKNRRYNMKQQWIQANGLEGWGTLNVLGQPAEPICTYYRCHHKFSLHGSRKCRCKHPTNKTLGIQVRYL